MNGLEVTLGWVFGLYPWCWFSSAWGGACPVCAHTPPPIISAHTSAREAGCGLWGHCVISWAVQGAWRRDAEGLLKRSLKSNLVN